MGKLEGAAFDDGAKALSDRCSLARIGVGHDNNELLSAVAASKIGTAHGRADAPREFLQHFIAGVMPIGVVDMLEAVNVRDTDRERTARAAARLNSVLR